MLLSQNLVKEALWKASSTGADYAEVFAEYTNSKTISMVSSKVDKIADGNIHVSIPIAEMIGIATVNEHCPTHDIS